MAEAFVLDDGGVADTLILSERHGREVAALSI
jgi:hypothetical protein